MSQIIPNEPITVTRQMMKAHAMAHPANLMRVVDYARAGWNEADEVLRELIIEFLDRGEQLPKYLAAYNMDILRKP